MVRRSLSLFGLRFGLQARLLLARMGWLPALSLLGLGVAAWLHLGWVPDMQRRASVSQLRMSELQAASAQAEEPGEQSSRYTQFRAQLASEDDRGELLKTLFKIAADSGVALNKADYRSKRDGDCGCSQLQIMLPVKGSYPQIRAFVDAALVKLPSLALDELSFRRENVKAALIEAHLRFTLYLRVED